MSRSILIVDNHTIEPVVLNHYNVYTASSYDEAMHILVENSDINLMIVDLNLPNNEGLALLENAATINKLNNLQIVVITEEGQIEKEVEALKMGAVDYIRKPFHSEALKAKIYIHVPLLNESHNLKLFRKDINFDTIFEQGPIGIILSHSNDPYAEDSDNNFTINPALAKITGWTKEEIRKLGWGKITHPDDIAESQTLFNKLIAGEIKNYSVEKRYIKPDGSIVWVYLIVASMALDNNYKNNHICFIQDITNRKKLEDKLYESERSKSVLLANLPGMAYRCNYDEDWTMQYVSAGCYNLTGYAPESLLYNRDLTFNDIISSEYREILWNEWKKILSDRSPFKFEYEITTASGERKWVLEMGQGVYASDGSVEALEGIILDISERKKMEDNLRCVSEHDAFTGLYNREYLEDLLLKDRETCGKIKRALMGVNLGNAHILTLNYGFHYTQNYIKKASEILSEFCTPNIQLFITYESRFVFYIKNYIDKNVLVDLSDNVGRAMEKLFETDRIGGAIDILEIEHSTCDNPDTLLRRLLIISEQSLKSNDKLFKICFYDKELEVKVNREKAILEELMRIITDENSEDFYLQYQPIYNIKNNTIFGYEALARLNSPKLGFVSPTEFIALAEKTKLIIPLGDKIFVNALKFLKKLNNNGYHNINVTINVSPIQLLKSDFAHNLFALINKIGVNPHNIGIDITESVFSDDYDYINTVISYLRSFGIQIYIDDFGTGYSSLARVRELKVDYIKIDKYFIDKLMKIERDKAITADIISMIHRLGHNVIAEGVECEAQKQYLIEFGCDKIQGYLYSKPLDEKEALNIIVNLNEKS